MPFPRIKTVKVARKDHPEGYVVINESDMTDSDVLFDKPKPKVVKKKARSVRMQSGG